MQRAIAITMCLAMLVFASSAASATAGAPEAESENQVAEIIDVAHVASDFTDMSDIELTPLSESREREVLASTGAADLKAVSHHVASNGQVDYSLSLLDVSDDGIPTRYRWAASVDGEIVEVFAEPSFDSSTVTLTSPDSSSAQVVPMKMAHAGCDSERPGCTAFAVSSTVTTTACAAGGAALIGADGDLGLGAVAAGAVCAGGLIFTAITGLTCITSSPYCPTPQTYIDCQQDSCYGLAEWASPSDAQDSTDVLLRWDFVELEMDHNDNENDSLLIPQSVEGESFTVFSLSSVMYHYVALDLVWHSDIRCDSYAVFMVESPFVQLSARGEDKEFPKDPNYPYCSDYGMDGEIT